jgi:molybdopterin-guanine dinucleotide biosynthesis protein A
MNRSRLAGAVLVGGRSTRMGRDKALVEVEGVAMAERVARVIDAIGARPVVLVGGAERPIGRPWVADLYPGEGPLGGIITALTEVDAERVAVLACDLPWIDQATLEALVDEAGDADVVCAFTDRRQPLCAIWRSRVLPTLRRAFTAGERSMQRLPGVGWADVTVASEPLTNINTPADLAEGARRPPAQ